MNRSFHLLSGTIVLALSMGSASATDYYFSDCATGGAGTQANPYCLDPGPGNNPAGNESFDYLMDGTGPELAAGDKVYLCAGACDGSGTSTWHLNTHPGWQDSASCTQAYRVVFDMEVSGTQANPITITPYCSGNNCETVILSGDSNNNNAYDAGVDAERFVSNIDCDGTNFVGGHGYYKWLGDPNGDGLANLIIEKVDFYVFGLQRNAPDWVVDGLEIRYMDRFFFPCTGNDCNNLKPNDGAGMAPYGVGCDNNNGERGTAFNIARSSSTQTMSHNRIHHGCFAALRPINNCYGSAPETCTAGQTSMIFENNNVYNMLAMVNGHQGKNWIIRGNNIHDFYYGIGVEEQVMNVLIEGNVIGCHGEYFMNWKGSDWLCRTAITVNDGDFPPTDGCADSGGSGGQCNARDVRIKRNRIYGNSYSGESGAGKGLLVGGISFIAHNSLSDLGTSVVENNMVWHTQATSSCSTDTNSGTMAAGVPNDVMESGIAVWSEDALLVQNNTIYDTGCWTMLIGGTGDHTVRNNLAVKSILHTQDTNLAEFRIMSNTLSGAQIQNNNFNGAGGADPVVQVLDGSNGTAVSSSYGCSAIGAFGTNNKCATTSFVNVSGSRIAWNPHLSSSDTANVNTGTTGAADDIDGQSRSGPVDIGADEILATDSVKPRAPTNLRVQ